MSILNRLSQVLGGVLFSFFLFMVILNSSFIQLSEYDTLKDIFIGILRTQFEEQISDIGGLSDLDKDSIYEKLQSSCEGEETVTIPINEDFGSIRIEGVEDLVIDCMELEDMEQKGIDIEERLMLIATKNIFDAAYYKEFDCDFVSCLLQENSAVVLSEKGHEFFVGINLYLWIATAIGAAIIIVSTETWDERLKGIGWPLFMIGVSYFLMTAMNDVILARLPIMEEAEAAGIDLSGTLDKFIDPIMDSLLVVLIVGIVLIIAGYALHYYQKKKDETLIYGSMPRKKQGNPGRGRPRRADSYEDLRKKYGG